MPGLELLDLPAGGVGGDRAVLPVRVLTELGGLADRPGCPPAEDAQIVGPAGEQVPVAAVPQQAGQVYDLRVGLDAAVGGQ